MKTVTIDELALMTKEGFDAVSDEFAWVRSELKDHRSILNEHTALLNEHSTILKEHSQSLNELRADLNDVKTITKDRQRPLKRMGMSVSVQEHQNAIFDTRLRRLET